MTLRIANPSAYHSGAKNPISSRMAGEGDTTTFDLFDRLLCERELLSAQARSFAQIRQSSDSGGRDAS